MPFLFPALTAAVCDVGILYLSRTTPIHDEDTTRRVYQAPFILPLACIRLFLLLVPYPYHSFKGKALRCPLLYRAFYGLTLVILLFHALSLIMVDPGSLGSLLPSGSDESNSNDDRKNNHAVVTRHLWWSVFLTFFSTLSHVALFYHVRSTAPSDGDLLTNKRRPKVLLYYVKSEKELEQSVRPSGTGMEAVDPERGSLLRNGGTQDEDDDHVTKWEDEYDDDDDDDDDHDDDDEEEKEFKDSDELLGKPKSKNRYQKRRRGSRKNRNRAHSSLTTIESSSSRSNPMHEISSKLLSDIQAGLDKTKMEWTKRLEDYQFRSSAGGGVVAGATGTQDSSSIRMTVSPTPFRVVLELFAGEDVLSNGRLEAVYDADSGTALMFFIPQLLSFLLHGAFECSPQLEQWVLETCHKNVFFAHKCFWFLRAWALESSNLTCSDGPPTPSMRLKKSSSLASFETEEFFEGSNNSVAPCATKLLPEECAVIEELMRKIMECGEEPARLVHFGSMLKTSEADAIAAADERFTSSPSALMALAESGGIPIDPSSGLPSAKHFECLAASRRFGFLPLDNALTNDMTNQGSKDGSYFDATPVFLDALLTIADGLFKVPRECRTTEFRKRLNHLEVEALPSNDIYIPLQDPYHRVWRIVSDESIAISTKERVPCIVCLEVVDYSPSEFPSTRDVRRMLETRACAGSVVEDKHSFVNDRETISRWFFKQRDPHRRESALKKLSHSIGHRLGRMPGKINTSMRTSIEKLKTTNKELQDLLTIKVPDSLSLDDDELERGHNSPNLHTHEPMPVTDIERGDEKGEHESKPVATESKSYKSLAHRPPRIPVSPRTSRSSSSGAMGQWTSPSLRNTEVDIVDCNSLPIEELVTPTLKRRSYQSVNSRSSSRGSLNVRAAPRGSLSSITSDVDLDKEKNGNGSNHPGDADGTPSKPPMKPPPVIFKESWAEKEERLRSTSAFGNHPGWRLLPVLVKSNDDLRQEQLASQLIYRVALILAREKVPVWLCPYEILALEAHGGIIEAIPDTISLASLKKNDPNFTDLKGFFHDFFDNADDLADAKANFCESLAAYSVVCFLLQIKDRHNGNILLDNRGHLIHIDFGFFFLSSPGKNTGFESAPFKLTREWVDLLGGADSHLFGVFRTLCYRSFIALRKHCLEIILLVEMLKLGNEELKCFRGRPDDAINELRKRFRLDLNDRACFEYVNSLVDTSLENWRTNWYDRYQRYCVGVL